MTEKKKENKYSFAEASYIEAHKILREEFSPEQTLALKQAINTLLLMYFEKFFEMMGENADENSEKN